MPVTQTKLFSALIGLGMFLACWVISYNSFRYTAAILFLTLIVGYIHFLWTSKMRWMMLIFVAFVVAAFLPLDVTRQNYPGPPRFVPLIMGSPTDEDVAREERGEVVLGGCIMRDNAPRWVLVW
jgi:hypothetical protein